MASAGHEISYKTGQKNHWRRWAWNHIRGRLPRGKAPKECTILYLAGAENLDCIEAARRGFDAANMIAIERSVDSAAALREQGVTTIIGDAVDVLACWNEARQVDVVILDTCAGLYLEASRRIQGVLFRRCFQGAVVAVNFQRGRDEISKIKSSLLTRINVLSARLGVPDLDPSIFANKHRGVIFSIDLAWTYFNLMSQIAHGGGLTYKQAADYWVRFWDPYFSSVVTKSYRQRVVTMDSAIFSLNYPLSIEPCNLDAYADNDLRPQVRAAMAVATMRRNGHLRRPSP